MATIKIPGMVDPHVHLRDMQWAHKATFASETAAAIAGGYWAVLDMPNTLPSTITREALDTKLTAISQQAVSDWGLYFGGAHPANTAEFPSVVHDVCGIKIFNNSTTGELLIEDQSTRDAIYEAWPANKVIAVHAEGKTVVDILELVRKHRKHTHFCHINLAEEIRYLRDAKAEGLPISLGVTPHHLYLTDQDVARLGPYGIMKPELKTQADQDALWQAITDGLVDVIESDHAPHTIAEKESEKPPYGVPGLETTLPLMGLAVTEGRLSQERLIEMIADNPRRIFGLNCDDATYTVVDMDCRFEIKRENLHTLCGWSPFEGLQVIGKVTEVWIRGQQVFDGENILIEQGFGNNIFGT